jgi:hypothetical protein
MMKRGIATAAEFADMHENASLIPVSETIVREYYEIQQAEKALEKRKEAMKPKLAMLIPIGEEAVTFRLPELPDKRFVARRISQDRRKPDDALLVALLESKGAPSEAFTRKPNEDFVAGMIVTKQITADEFKKVLRGKVIEYVSLTARKEGEPDDD